MDGSTNFSIQNKILYIDNWATWCGPCVQSIKKSLKKKLKIPENVLMVYVSFDRLMGTSSALSRKNNFEGKNMVHIFNKGGNGSDYAKYYNITSLPKYMVVVDGKVADCLPHHPIALIFKST